MQIIKLICDNCEKPCGAVSPVTALTTFSVFAMCEECDKAFVNNMLDDLNEDKALDKKFKNIIKGSLT